MSLLDWPASAIQSKNSSSESRKVHAVSKLMNATVSSNSSPLLDFQLMLLSARFLGNRASSMSVNIASLRNTLFHKNAKTLLL